MLFRCSLPILSLFDEITLHIIAHYIWEVKPNKGRNSLQEAGLSSGYCPPSNFVKNALWRSVFLKKSSWYHSFNIIVTSRFSFLRKVTNSVAFYVSNFLLFGGKNISRSELCHWELNLKKHGERKSFLPHHKYGRKQQGTLICWHIHLVLVTVKKSPRCQSTLGKADENHKFGFLLLIKGLIRKLFSFSFKIWPLTSVLSKATAHRGCWRNKNCNWFFIFLEEAFQKSLLWR